MTQRKQDEGMSSKSEKLAISIVVQWVEPLLGNYTPYLSVGVCLLVVSDAALSICPGSKEDWLTT